MIRELLDFLKEHVDHDCDALKVDIEYVPIIIEALEKQMPKKPLDREPPINSTIEYGKCPTCGAYLNDWDEPKFCYECGQAVKWSGYLDNYSEEGDE